MRSALEFEQRTSWVHLVHLIFFFFPLFFVRFSPLHYGLMALALASFLYCYFWAYRSGPNNIHWPLTGIVLTAILITPINPGALSLFIYASFFVAFAYPMRLFLLCLAGLVAIMLALDTVFTLHWELFLPMGIPLVLAVGLIGRYERLRQQKVIQDHQSTDEIKQLAAMVERERIARDLHDILGHTLSSIILKADLAEKLLVHQKTDEAQQQLGELSQVARDALSQVRQSVSGYKHQGLNIEVSKLLGRLRDAGFQAELKGDLPELNSRQETAVILALTELVTNVIRHSRGDYCQLQWSQQADQLIICLTDNGPCKEVYEGNGITGLRERLAAVGGALSLSASDGVSACIQLPLTEKTL